MTMLLICSIELSKELAQGHLDFQAIMPRLDK